MAVGLVRRALGMALEGVQTVVLTTGQLNQAAVSI